MWIFIVFYIAAGDTTRIVATSCHGQFYLKNSEMFASIHSLSPNLFIWTGDSIYSDLLSFPNSLDITNYKEWKKLYDNQKAMPEYALIKNGTKITGVWDDHDYGVNDGDSSFYFKGVSQELFMDFI